MSIAVIAVLLTIMAPSLRRANDTAKQVVCSSNTRQIGLGLMMYADDYKSELPPSRYIDEMVAADDRADLTVVVRESGNTLASWDGLGLLFAYDYLRAPKVFYCPAHSGDYPFARFSNQWSGSLGAIVANYQYRGNLTLSDDTQQAALVTDSLRTRSDFNHKVGANVLRGDFSVVWFADQNRTIFSALPESESDEDAAEKINSAWRRLDAEVKQGK